MNFIDYLQCDPLPVAALSRAGIDRRESFKKLNEIGKHHLQRFLR